jgi:hypothetical protein
MSTRHTITVTPALEALGVELTDFTAEVAINWIPESGDGWNEPRERAYAELSEVKQVSGPFIKRGKLTDWAELWVKANQDVIAIEIADTRAF